MGVFMGVVMDVVMGVVMGIVICIFQRVSKCAICGQYGGLVL